MKKNLAISVAICALLALAVFYFWGPSVVPAGQESLLTLSSDNFTPFEKAFDAWPEQSRLILLVSPT